jgi:hypothetical protein
MSRRTEHRRCSASVADEAARYLETVDLFASLDADPHADARARAAVARAREQNACERSTTATRKAVFRWRS